MAIKSNIKDENKKIKTNLENTSIEINLCILVYFYWLTSVKNTSKREMTTKSKISTKKSRKKN